MPDPVLVKALEALDLAVIEVLPGRKLELFSPPPSWFKGLVHWAALPFLEHVLPEAEVLWESTTEGALGFGPFTVQTGGDELLLRVRALRLEGQRVLAIDRLIHEIDPRPALRQARTQALELEDLVRRTRETHALAAALTQGIEQLRLTGLSASQLTIVDATAQSLVQLQELIGAFPPPYARRRPGKPVRRTDPAGNE